MTSNIPLEFQNYIFGSEMEINKLYRILLAIDLYLKEIVSLNKAAELSGLSFEGFLNELRLRKIHRITGYEDIESLEKEDQAFQKFMKS